MENFTGKLAVVTGGASGVGLAIGSALAREGAKVILTDIEAGSLESSARALIDESLDVHFKVADVSNPESMTQLSSWCQSEHGPVHLLFNNAGVAPAEMLPIWETKPNDWQWAYSVNARHLTIPHPHFIMSCTMLQSFQQLQQFQNFQFQQFMQFQHFHHHQRMKIEHWRAAWSLA